MNSFKAIAENMGMEVVSHQVFLRKSDLCFMKCNHIWTRERMNKGKIEAFFLHISGKK